MANCKTTSPFLKIKPFELVEKRPFKTRIGLYDDRTSEGYNPAIIPADNEINKSKKRLTGLENILLIISLPAS
jgi:hypothetical protein